MTTIDANAVISTVPASRLVEVSTPSPSEEVQEAARGLEHRGMVFVYLVVPRSQYTEFDAHYFPGLDTLIARLSEPKNYRTGPDPEGQTVLCAELACTVGDDVWETSDDDLAALVARQIAEQGLPGPEHIDSHVRKLPSVYPVYRHGYRQHLDAIEQWTETQPQLITAGRQGLFVPDNLHHTIAMGRAAAQAVRTDGSIDKASWRSARARFRTHVVED